MFIERGNLDACYNLSVIYSGVQENEIFWMVWQFYWMMCGTVLWLSSSVTILEHYRLRSVLQVLKYVSL